MQQPKTGPRNTPAIPGMAPLTLEQVTWARCRPPADRVPAPEVGAVVGYRAEAHGPVIKATVVEIQTDQRQDPNVWRYIVPDPAKGPLVDDDGERLTELVDDPWFEVKLAVRPLVGPEGNRKEGPLMFVWTREARLPGSPGWLPWRD